MNQTSQTGYASVNDLKIYYGAANLRVRPLVLLHGGVDTIGPDVKRKVTICIAPCLST